MKEITGKEIDGRDLLDKLEKSVAVLMRLNCSLEFINTFNGHLRTEEKNINPMFTTNTLKKKEKSKH